MIDFGPISIVFMGTAELASASLRELAAARWARIVSVVSQPDKQKGRELKFVPTPVKVVAQELGLPVLQPARARDPGFVEQLRSLQPEIIVVVAYGQILPQAILDIPKFGAINVHTSILPRHRGAAPIQWAIVNGDQETGVTIMKMDEGLDTGPILRERRVSILPSDNGQTLHDRLATLGGQLLVETLPGYITGKIGAVAQPVEGMTYARKISKEDGRIDWSLDCHQIGNRVRGFYPWPATYSILPQPFGKMLKILEAIPEPELNAQPGEVISAGRDGLVVGCGSGALRLISVQKEGGRRMNASEFCAGHNLVLGSKFGS